jgi:hypothetical protein
MRSPEEDERKTGRLPAVLLQDFLDQTDRLFFSLVLISRSFYVKDEVLYVADALISWTCRP